MIIDIVLGFASGRGGLESVLTMVTNELKKRGHKVRLFQRFITMTQTLGGIVEHIKVNLKYFDMHLDTENL
jgi:hypothetical protein